MKLKELRTTYMGNIELIEVRGEVFNLTEEHLCTANTSSFPTYYDNYDVLSIYPTLIDNELGIKVYIQ